MRYASGLRPDAFGDQTAFHAEVSRFIDWVKSAERVDPDQDILMPGEIEDRTRAVRIRDGIVIDPATWEALSNTARSLGINPAPIGTL